jgi:hypothetical protein
VVGEVLSKLKAIGKADRTVFHYTTGFKSFTAWLKKEHRTRRDLLQDLDRPAVVTETERPALRGCERFVIRTLVRMTTINATLESQKS